MVLIQDFLSQYDKVISLVSFIFMIIFSLLLYKKTGNVKYLLEVLNKMKYKTETTFQDTSVQTFSNLKPVYRLNKSTGQLEKTDDFIDIDEIVRSSLTTTLDFILDKFLPNSMGVSDEVAERDVLNDKLDVMQNAFEFAEELKTKYKLDSNLSLTEVFAKVKELSVNISKDIEEKQKVINSVKPIVEKVKETTEIKDNGVVKDA